MRLPASVTATVQNNAATSGFMLDVSQSFDQVQAIAVIKKTSQSSNKLLTKTFFVSVLIHVVLFTVIVLTINANNSQNTLSNTQVTEVRLVKSYLYTAPQNKIPTQRNEERVTPSLLSKPMLKPTVRESTEQAGGDNTSKEKAVIATKNQNTTDEPLTAKSSDKRISISDTTASYFAQKNKEALNLLVQSETKNYELQKDLGAIPPIAERVNTWVVDTEIKPKFVNCGNKAIKLLAAISGSSGGRLQCQQYEFQEFIDNRINKEK